MASGLAVAATDIPGTRDALGADSQSMLTPPGDHVALAANIVRLLCDDGLRQQEGERNRRRAAQVFNTERMCAETTEVIARVLSNTPYNNQARFLPEMAANVPGAARSR